MKPINELCNVVRPTAYGIHVYLGNGHLEKVYENALIKINKHRGPSRGLSDLIVYLREGELKAARVFLSMRTLCSFAANKI